MKKWVTLLLLVPQFAWAVNGPVLWGSPYSTNLQSGICMTGSGACFISGSANPSSVATFGNQGSIYLDTTNNTPYIKSDGGTTTNWTAMSGGGTVSSVAVTVPSGLAVSGSPVTGSGTIAITASGQFVASQMPAFTGDATTSAGSVATTIANSAVTNAKMANMVAHTYKGNNTGSTAAPADVSNTNLLADLAAFIGDAGSGGTKGLVPAPAAGDAAAGKFLKANGLWAVPAGGGSGTVTSVSMPTQWGGSPITVSGTFTNPAPNVTAKTTNYTVTTSDYEIRVNCATACTITMPTPGSTGAHYLLKNYATSTYALVTIAAHASETFCGPAYASVHMSTPGEYWEFIDDGTNWSCAQHKTETTDIQYTLTPLGSTTNPTLGTTTTNQAYWSRIGNKMTVNYNFVQTTAGSGGSGTWEFPIFTGTSSDFAINTTSYPASTNASTSVAAVGASSTVGSGMFFGSCQLTHNFVVGVYDSTDFKLFVSHDDSYFTSSYCAWTSTILAISFSATVPIVNWEP